jgi:hypothetical protein
VVFSFVIWHNSPFLHHSLDHVPQCNYMFYVTQIYIKCFNCGIIPNCNIHNLQVQMVVYVTLQLFLQTAQCNVHLSYFVLVGCILLHYLYMLYKHTTQKLYICDPQTQLNNFFTVLAFADHICIVFVQYVYIAYTSLNFWP